LSKRFVITGPESSGKTTLAELLAKEYQTTFLKEFAREYLENLDRTYELEDLLIMAKEQLKQEKESPDELVFLDTDLTVFAIWIKEKYNKEIDWITEHLKTNKDKTYFLCDIDIKWEEDELREHPSSTDRKRLFEAYKDLLDEYQLPYHVISGDIPSRLKKCKEIINTSI
jgi:nicotinamide riboside kinase